MITQPASAGLQLLGVLFCFLGGGLLLDPLFGGEMAWGWGLVWGPFGVWLFITGGRGQRVRIAKRDASRVQVLSAGADTVVTPAQDDPDDPPKNAKGRFREHDREAARDDRRATRGRGTG